MFKSIFYCPLIRLSLITQKKYRVFCKNRNTPQILKHGFLVIFFLFFAMESKGDQLCPNSWVFGGCSIINGCIYNNRNGTLVACGDNSHYYEASGDFDLAGRENYLFITLPLDDYIILMGFLPTIYAFIKLRKKENLY